MNFMNKTAGRSKKAFLLVIMIILLLASNKVSVFADSDTPTPSPTLSETPTTTPMSGVAVTCVSSAGQYSSCSQFSLTAVKIDVDTTGAGEAQRVIAGWKINLASGSKLYFSCT